jgi:hypothetical protein
MKNMIRKTLVTCAVTAAMGLTASASAESLFPEFTINEGVVDGAKANIFTANRIIGGYEEKIVFNPSGIGASNGSFTVDLTWAASQFFLSPSITPPPNQLNGNPLAGPAQYGIFALYNGTGTYSQANGVTKFSFTPESGSLQLFLDPTPELAGDANQLLATGVPTFGEGTLDPTLSTCGTNGPSGVIGINCGSFGATTTLELTNFGKTYFIAPNPFYAFSFQSGQLNNFQVGVSQTITGSLDVVFGNAVPEPATVALIGLGLLGFSASRRKRK